MAPFSFSFLHFKKERIFMDEIQYPSNSYRSKQEQEQKRQVEKVTQGKVSQKKKPASKQIMESFVKEDAGTIGSHILFDIIIFLIS